jgi:hypothetical protein
MNVWEIEFEVRWSFAKVGDWDEEHEWLNVVAPDYDSALATARQEVMEKSFDDIDNPDVVHTVVEARLLSIKCGVEVDAIAKVAA